ncbi:transglutaminase family protein [Aquisalinus flavus]|uniref:Transglutaminase n=1 Tax=Aquisalinus flavus TaxID=1526572 RepID=A0A8J2V5Z3_9PROT|nr:transglutaminase family protein [Aquisalinus flavus]MBD0425255.1 transglutaminase family protein [Aquisalinus flavus]UNE49089.1 transglutaminase family protein [Aquisalinus flavus]GGD17526.1 transglutaminase [Aquisalinus flavus]
MEHRIRHLSTYSYDPAALRIALRLKLFPVDHEGQQVESWKVTVNDEEVSPLVFSDLGDREALWSSHEAIDRLDIVAEGKIVTRDTAGVVRGLPGNAPPGIFRRVTDLTEADKAIRALIADARQDDRLAMLHGLMGQINERVTYLTGSTSASTSAADALKSGKGVCQDHAHLFIAACRAADIPARYITGYLKPDADSDIEAPAAALQAQGQSQSQSQSQGSDKSDGQSQSQSQESGPLLETHAWGEAWIDGIGWIGFDPSNNVCPTENYVRLCSGLDAVGAAPIRGNVLGETKESLEVSVAIGQSQQ